MPAPEFLSGGGELGALIRAHHWAATPLGEPGGWPQGLKTAVRLPLSTRHPIFVFWGPEQVCLYNDAYRASLGPEKHPSALGARARQVWPEIWEIIGPQIDLVLRGGGSTWHENQLVPILRHGEMQEVYWTYSYAPIDEESAPGGIGGVLVICTETTARVLAERRTASERENFAELFQQAPTFMAVLRGPEHRVELVNPGYMRLIGDRDVVGRTVAEALPDAVAQGYLALLDEVFRSGEPYVATGARYAMQSAPGGPVDERSIDFVYQPIKDAEGAVTAIFVEGVDVTARAMAAAALRDAKETLEAKVEERTSALMAAEAALRQSQKMEAIGQLTGGIAHDFNNLLQGLSGSLDLIRRKPDDREQVCRWADAGLQAAERGSRLTAQLLAFSRAQKLDARPVVAEDLVVGMGDLLGRTLGPGVRIVLHPDLSRVAALCDATQLEMALLNLAINARDAMPDGGELMLSVAPREVAQSAELAGGRYVEIAVRDTGAGMSAAVAARAFDPFFTTKPLGKGTGLGLSQVYAMARQAGGTARIESEPGRGTTVRLWLPRTEAGAAEAAAPMVRAEPRQGEVAATVLVVDDDPDVRRFLADSLEALGYAALEAADGAAGSWRSTAMRPM